MARPARKPRLQHGDPPPAPPASAPELLELARLLARQAVDEHSLKLPESK
jgi:hypothetical protein